MTDTVIMITVLAVLLMSVAFYVLPSIIAMARKLPSTGSVVVINILLGWTFVGWVIALAMALRSHPRPHTLVRDLAEVQIQTQSRTPRNWRSTTGQREI